MSELHLIIDDLGYLNCPDSWRGLKPKLRDDGDWIDRCDNHEAEDFLAPRAAFADFLLERGIV